MIYALHFTLLMAGSVQNDMRKSCEPIYCRMVKFDIEKLGMGAWPNCMLIL